MLKKKEQQQQKTIFFTWKHSFPEGKEKLMQFLSSESSENVVNNSWEESLRDGDLPGNYTGSSQNSVWHEISVLQLPLCDLYTHRKCQGNY